MFYVYKHIRPDTGQVFYIGSGHGNRAQYFQGRNRAYSLILKQLQDQGLSPTIEIVCENLSEKDARNLECELIRSTDGLVNFTGGGEKSRFGSKWTEEQKQAARKPKPEGFGEKISKALSGRKMSEEQKEAIRQGMLRGNRKGKGGDKSRELKKKQWENPDYREKMLNHLRTPEARAAQSERAKKSWAERKEKQRALHSENE